MLKKLRFQVNRQIDTYNFLSPSRIRILGVRLQPQKETINISLNNKKE